MTFQPIFTKDDLLNFFQAGDIDTEQVKAFATKYNVQIQSVTKRMNKLPQFQKLGRGRWNLTAQEIHKAFVAPSAQPAVETSYIPDKDNTYVPFGNYNSLKKIIQSKMFYPAFITGLSGNGKTFSVEQACAALGRELIRVCLLYTSPSPRDPE